MRRSLDALPGALRDVRLDPSSSTLPTAGVYGGVSTLPRVLDDWAAGCCCDGEVAGASDDATYLDKGRACSRRRLIAPSIGENTTSGALSPSGDITSLPSLAARLLDLRSCIPWVALSRFAGRLASGAFCPDPVSIRSGWNAACEFASGSTQSAGVGGTGPKLDPTATLR